MRSSLAFVLASAFLVSTAFAVPVDSSASERALVLITYRGQLSHSSATTQQLPRAQMIHSLETRNAINQRAVLGDALDAQAENLWIAHGTIARLTNTEISKIAANPRVQSVTPLGRAVHLVSDKATFPGFDLKSRVTFEGESYTHGLEKIGIPRLRAERPDRDGRGVRVGIIDSGIDPAHPALKGRVAFFKDFVSGRDSVAYDDHGHGTHVAGTIAGGVAQGWTSGEFIGVAPAAELIVAKAFSQDGSSIDKSILEAMQWMTHPNADPKNAPRIVSNSWTVDAHSRSEDPSQEPFCAAVQTWIDLGITPVFASGNDGPGVGTVSIPASCPGAIAVGATDENDQMADFSSRGPGVWKSQSLDKPQLVAPGTDIDSAEAGGGGIASKSGTSMAAPHVAGALALLLQDLPATAAGAERAKQALLSGAFPLNSTRPNNDSGAGRLDVYHSFEVLK